MLLIRYIGRVEYAEALELQRQIFDQIVSSKMEGNRSEGTILLVEHPHVYTLGKSAHEGNLLVDSEFIDSIGARCYKTDRGGDVTYHGQGQLVGYPILDLEQIGIGLREYIELLEQAIIDTVAEYGIAGMRVEGATGVWVGGTEDNQQRGDLNQLSEQERGYGVQQSKAAAEIPRKICAIGVKVSRSVTMHGFALNATTDLSYFSYINPCGFTDRGVTSIEKETGLRPELESLGVKFVENFRERLSQRG